MKIKGLWDDMLWLLVNTDILGEGTACSFSIISLGCVTAMKI